MSAQPQTLKALTSLRFFAALWVVAYHYWDGLGAAVRPLLIAKGYLGVELFFVLSGFILSHVYLEDAGKGGFRYGGFLWARLARIFPLHLATLIGFGLIALLAQRLGANTGDKVVVWSSLPAELTLTQAWGLAPLGGWNHPSWSISAEWMAYLAFPLFAWTAWRLRARPALALALALAAGAAMYLGFEHATGQSLTQATIAWGALRIVPCFGYGCALYLAWRALSVKASRHAPAAALAVFAALLFAIGLGAPDMVMVALFGALIFWLGRFGERGSFMTSPLGVYLGEVSFAVYMVCIPWQVVFTHLAGRSVGADGMVLSPTLWALMFAGVIPAAMLAHHLIERPARLAMRRWRWLRPARQTRPAAA